MQCSALKELPRPLSNKSGWPWTEESPQIPDAMPNGSPWPKISIVTPSLGQGQFIEETIRSVLLQGYPNLEYIIIDGGSDDVSAEIIKKYEKWLTYWVSESDRGQSHAINKGFAKATGDIFAYINSDDYYEQNAFFTIARIFSQNKNIRLVAGECEIFDNDTVKRTFKPWWPKNIDHLLHPFGSTFAQPASFWSREIYERVGGFNESSHYCFDKEFFLNIGLCEVTPLLISDKIVRYRDHSNTKTSHTIRFYEEAIPVIHKYAEACKLSDKAKNKLLRQCIDEIGYIQTFIQWKNHGRLQALLKFLSIILRSPLLLSQRKVLGLARRLISYKASDVKELKNV